MTRMGFFISAVASRNGIYQTDGEGRSGVGGLEFWRSMIRLRWPGR